MHTVSTKLKEMFRKGVKIDQFAEDLAELPVRDALEQLKTLSEAHFKQVLDYYANLYELGRPIISDETYDKLEDFFKQLYPATTQGQTKRANDFKGNLQIKVQLPYVLPSIDKAKTVEKLDNFYGLMNENEIFICSDKEDGMSALLTEEKKLLTQGDGFIGTDITHVLSHVNNMPSNVFEKMAKLGISDVRGELIISKENFEWIQINRPGARKGTEFKTARNTVVGAVGDKSMNLEILKRISFVAYECYYKDVKVGENKTPAERFQDLSECDFEVANPEPIEGNPTFAQCKKMLEERRRLCKYKIDGMIIARNVSYRVQSAQVPRKQLKILGTKAEIKNNNVEESEVKIPYPEDAIAFKVDSTSGVTTVVNVEYNASRFCKMFPTVKVTPYQLGEITNESVSGKCSEFIQLYCLEPGTVVEIGLAGDVIPEIVNVVKKGPTGKGQFPPGEEGKDWEWRGEKNIYCLDSFRRDIQQDRCRGFFDAFKAPGMREGTVDLLFAHFYDEKSDDIKNTHGPLHKILQCDVDDLLQIRGFQKTKAENVYKSIQMCTQNVKLAKLMEASSLFDEGFGKDRFGKICDMYPEILRWNMKTEALCQLAEGKLTKCGLNKLATQFVKCLPTFQQWVKSLPMISIAVTASGAANVLPKATFGGSATPHLTAAIELPKYVAFSGLRDTVWEQFLNANGSKVQSSVTKSTEVLIVKSKLESSTKINAAKKNGIPLMTKEEFIAKYKLSKQ